MALRHSSSVASRGLILSIDAANSKSYSGSGTTWFDLSGNGKNGSMTGGVQFNSNNKGIMVFDGVDDVVTFGVGSNFFPLNEFSINMWFRSLGTVATTGITPGLFGLTYGIRAYINENSMAFGVDNGTSAPILTVAGTFRTDQKWYNATFYCSSNNYGVYINGTLANSATINSWSGTTRWPGDGFRIGRDNNNPSQFFYGEIATCSIYSRILSASEVNYSFNAVRGRFGI